MKTTFKFSMLKSWDLKVFLDANGDCKIMLFSFKESSLYSALNIKQEAL